MPTSKSTGVISGAAAWIATASFGFAAGPSLSDATLFRTDSTGTNQGATTQINYGAWTTGLNIQNVPGNYGAELFLTKSSTPGPNSFFTPASSFSVPLNPGTNTFYFYADGDDQRGGAFGFGLNLYLDGAAAGSPAISTYNAPGTSVGPGSPDASSTTAGYDFSIVPGAGTVLTTSDGDFVTLTNYQITFVGGPNGDSPIDVVDGGGGSTPYTPPVAPDGITDTVGTFTLTVIPVPEPCVAALAGITTIGVLARRKRTSA